MSAEFDVYLAGRCVDGFDPAAVKAGIARTFNLSLSAADKLMDGQRHRVKSACDHATAIRYQEAITRIGAIAEISEVTAAPAAPGARGTTGTVESLAPETRTSGISIAPVGAVLGTPNAHDSVHQVTIPDYELSDAGTVIPNLPDDRAPVNPPTEHLQLTAKEDP